MNLKCANGNCGYEFRRKAEKVETEHETYFVNNTRGDIIRCPLCKGDVVQL